MFGKGNAKAGSKHIMAKTRSYNGIETMIKVHDALIAMDFERYWLVQQKRQKRNDLFTFGKICNCNENHERKYNLHKGINIDATCDKIKRPTAPEPAILCGFTDWYLCNHKTMNGVICYTVGSVLEGFRNMVVIDPKGEYVLLLLQELVGTIIS